jgi:hypothetical protein
MSTGRLAAKIVIEAHHPMNLGAGEIEGLGDDGLRPWRDAAENRLKIVQNG